MSLDRVKNLLVFTCDGDGEDACHEVLETGTTEFMEAKAELDEEGWRAFREDGEWGHRCPDCVKSWARR